MKYIKLILISAVVLFGLLTLISLLLPSTVIVSRAKDISASPDSVYKYVADLSTWKKWLYSKNSAAVIIAADGKSVALDRSVVTITSSSKEKITSQWRIGDGEPMYSEFNFITGERSSTHFTLQWAFTQKLKWYPWEKFASILSDKALGPFMEDALDKLKKQVETPAQQ
jgi:hypothetical protein